MESFTQAKLILLAFEVLLILGGIAAWIAGPRRQVQQGLVWSAPITDTLFLGWALLLGGFMGQLAGVLFVRAIPDSTGSSEALQLLVIGTCFDGGLIAAWLGISLFMRAKGQPLPVAIENPMGVGRTFGAAGLVFLRALPVVGAVGIAASYALRAFDMPVDQQDIVGVFARTGSPFALAGLLVLATVLAPVAEELVFRAGVFRVLRGRIGRWPAIAVSSSLFALLHGSVAGFAGLFCLGAAFCLAYERTRNIAVPMVAHGLFNLNSIILILTLPAELMQ